MPTYKLTYFNLKARAEPTRYLFALAGVEFEDVRISDEEWQKLKASEFAPLKQIPILEMDGEKLYQSHAIHYFVAEETGFLGTSAIERGKILAIVETCRDLSLKLAESKFEKDETRKEELKKGLHETIPKYTAFFESQLNQNKESDWFVAKKVSLADVMVFNFFVDKMGLGLNAPFHNFPVMKGFIKRFADIPEIKTWIEKRPPTVF